MDAGEDNMIGFITSHQEPTYLNNVTNVIVKLMQLKE